MADPTGWETPITDWETTDGILNTDFNRIEGNTEILKDLLYTYRGTFGARITNTYFSAQVDTTWTYEIVNRMVFISIPTGVETPDWTDKDELQVAPVAGTWPANIIPTSEVIVPCIFKINTHDDYNKRSGYMLIPSSASSNIVCYITKPHGVNTSGYFWDDFFYYAGGGILKKAIPKQTISYMVDSFPTETTTTTTAAP